MTDALANNSSSMKLVPDQEVRVKAIKVDESFIVQAPAGAGKTSLLTQRILNLLTTVDNPEEIIAVTFTRKAAAEMRHRLLEALSSAKNAQEPAADHEKRTWQLAGKVLEKDSEHTWQLLKNPNRLRVLTIDSLSSLIANQMPLLSKLGGSLSITDFAENSYQQAARSVLHYLDDDEYGPALIELLAHLDNQVERLVSLLAKMLAKRDQWLRLLGAGELDIGILQQGLLEIAQLRLQSLAPYYSIVSNPSFIHGLHFAAGFIEQDHILSSLRNINGLPDLSADNLALWKGIADFCLTAQGTFRKTLNKNQGLLADKDLVGEDKAVGKQVKLALKQLFTEWSEIDGLAECLQDIHHLPIAEYSPNQQNILRALLKLLRLATIELNVDFQTRSEADFIEIALAADRALGYFEEPSELALKLDYQISHILVDEFQDTSFTQYRLLNKLIAGWQQGDGRTLFLVGDPMQSIYRFREANVGLFMQTQQEGMGDLAITPLTLKANFRSSTAIIDWVNNKFRRIFPQHQDTLLGAVTYSDAIAMKVTEVNDGVEFLAQFDQSEISEAQSITQRILQIRAQHPEHSIAILVRGRAHAQPIMQALSESNISFYAKDMQYLKHKAVISDLLAMTRLLLQPQDSIAWLALLKSPYIGLPLQDITYINHTFSHHYWRLLEEDDGIGGIASVTQLSQSSRQKLEHCSESLNQAIKFASRQGLAKTVETLWLQLGGPAALLSAIDIDAAMAYFKVVLELEKSEPITHIGFIEKAMSDLYAEQPKQAGAVEIMTMHKSKGLEFDTVILPSLERRKRADEHQLLLWEEFTSNDTQHYLLAPIQAQEKIEPIYQLARDIQNKKAQFEDARLLYVAATRAKKRLILSCQLNTRFDERKEQWIYSPISNQSLLYYLKDFYQKNIDEAFAHLPFDKKELVVEQQTHRDWYRLKTSIDTSSINDLAIATNEQQLEVPIDYDWASDVARVVGIVLHKLLEYISKDHLTFADLETHHYQIVWQQVREWLPKLTEQQQAVNKITKALNNMQQDPDALWILSKQQDAQSEWSLTGVVNQHGEKVIKSFVIDRTFVDQKGVRWIIDYKTGEHLGADLDVFFQSEKERYTEQLNQYEFLVRQIDNKPVKKALYFPMHKKLVTIE